MQRLLAILAVYKFAAVMAIFLTALVLDPVAVISALLTAIASLISTVAREPEVFVVVVPLILLTDIIGVVTSTASLFSALPYEGATLPYIAFYIVAIIWDSEVLRIARRLTK